MAVNPLATEDLTIDFRELMEIPISQRVAAAETSGAFVDAILKAMTPFQVAQAFPSYYKQALPDISNFITANIDKKLAAAGRGYDQSGGGDGGTARPSYGGEGKLSGGARPQGTPEPTVADMQKALLAQGIDIGGIYSAVGDAGILADDDKVKALKNMSDEDLIKAGLQRTKGEDGKVTIKRMAAEAQALSDEEVLKRASGKVAKGTGNLEGKQKLQKQVYDSFVNAGFSDNQAKALTAEVGRENDYSERYVYGKHVDANNSKVNLGFFSWQGSRGTALLERMKAKGLIDGNGAIIQSQESLDEMALFTKDEMENIPDYARTKKQFLDNPDISQQEAAEVLGNNFIRWDMAGKKIDPGPHIRKRDEYYAQIGEINKEFPGLVPENATPDQIAAAREKLIAEERTQEADSLTRLLYSKESITSTQRPSAQGMDLETNRSSAISFLDNTERNPDGANLVDVDERLLEITEMGIKKFEAENPNLKVEIYGPNSGKRQTSKTKNSQHLLGKALDYEIFEIDPDTGKKIKRLANFSDQQGSGAAADEYLRLHQNIELARIYKKDVIKDSRYSDVYGRSGALFGGDYALDTMHYDIGGSAGSGLESAAQPGGSIFGGYNREYINRFGIQDPAALEKVDLLETSKLAYGPKTEMDSNVAETTPTETQEPTAQPEETQQAATEPESPLSNAPPMALGGFIPEKDNLSVTNDQGDVVAKINEGELQQGITREGSGLRVESNKKRMAESLVSQNERSMYDSDAKEPEADQEPDQQRNAGGFRQVPRPPTATSDVMPRDRDWREKTASASYPIGSQIRAFKRTKFMQEGYHFNRATPGSQT